MSKAIPGFLIVAALVCVIVPPYTVGMGAGKSGKVSPQTAARTYTSKQKTIIEAQCPNMIFVVIVRNKDTAGTVKEYLIQSDSNTKLPYLPLFEHGNAVKKPKDCVSSIMNTMGFPSDIFEIRGLVDVREISAVDAWEARLIYLVVLKESNNHTPPHENFTWENLQDFVPTLAKLFNVPGLQTESMNGIRDIIKNRVPNLLCESEKPIDDEEITRICHKVIEKNGIQIDSCGCFGCIIM